MKIVGLFFQVSPDVKNNHGETPLFVAIRSNQLACVQQLINAGTRISLVDNRGGSALHTAAKNGNVTVIDMLLTTSELEERDVDINRSDNIGYTPIYYAINASRWGSRSLLYSQLRINTDYDMNIAHTVAIFLVSLSYILTHCLFYIQIIQHCRCIHHYRGF